jgi:3-deoxy-7-phosphoheptulonate synthase
MAEQAGYRRAALHAREGVRSTITVGGHSFGGGHFAVIGGAPATCSADDVRLIGRALASAGAAMLHDGTASQMDPELSRDPDRIRIFQELREETGLPIALAVQDVAQLEAVEPVADVIQLAAYQMQNYILLSALGEVRRPVILRRGSGNTVEELLYAAEYILARGNEDVFLCERGIRAFEQAYAVSQDFAAIPMLALLSHLPILLDPSELRLPELTEPVARGAAATGTDGVVLEITPDRAKAIPRLFEQLRAAAALAERTMAG